MWFSKILIREKIVKVSKNMVNIMKKRCFTHPDKEFYMKYLENINNIPSHQDLYSELRHRVALLLDEEKYMNVGFFVKNRKRF